MVGGGRVRAAAEEGGEGRDGVGHHHATPKKQRSGACPGSQDGEVQVDLLLAVIVRFSQDGSGGSGQIFQVVAWAAKVFSHLEKFSAGEGVRRSIGQGPQTVQP